MRATIATTMAVSLLALPALADNARPRTGGGSSSSSSAGRHPSPSASSSSHRSGSSSSASQHSGSSGPRTAAQARHPRPGSGHGHGGYYPGHRPCYGCGSYPYYYGYYGYPYYGYGLGYGWYGGVSSVYHYYPDSHGSLRVQVLPEDTRVYVDGYYAGVADDFDGMFQRLEVSPGRHQITLKMEGYRTHRFRVHVPGGGTIKLHHHMAKGSGEDPLEDLAGPAEREEPARGDRYAEREKDAFDQERERERQEENESEDDGEDDGPAWTMRQGQEAEGGELRLSVRPSDASVYVDGEFKGSARQLERLSLPAGSRRIEIVRPGYRTFERVIEVGGEEPTELKIELERP